MPRAIRESATAKGMTPPAAIKPMGDEISKARIASWLRAGPVIKVCCCCRRKTQRAMLAVIDESQDFRDRGILDRQRLHLVQPFGKNAGSVKQFLIERSYARRAVRA